MRIPVACKITIVMLNGSSKKKELSYRVTIGAQQFVKCELNVHNHFHAPPPPTLPPPTPLPPTQVVVEVGGGEKVEVQKCSTS